MSENIQRLETKEIYLSKTDLRFRYAFIFVLVFGLLFFNTFIALDYYFQFAAFVLIFFSVSFLLYRNWKLETKLHNLSKSKKESELITMKSVEKIKLVEDKLKEALLYRDEFITIASHEFKTPLTALKLQLQMFKKSITQNGAQTYSPEKVLRIVTDSEKQVGRLVRLVDDILDISRLRTGPVQIFEEKVDLDELLKEILKNVNLHFGKLSSTLELTRCDPCVVFCDRSRMEQVMTHLLSNAVIYGRGKPVKIFLRNLVDQVEFVVEDQGIGMACEDLKKIFMRFHRAVPASEISGLGLGLYIAKQIVEAHKGKIVVESQVGQGATFKVTLPVSLEE